MNAMRAPESIAQLRARKADHRTEAGDLRMELDARRVEAFGLVTAAAPYLSRLETIAHEFGPVALHQVMALRGLLRQHEARWTPDTDSAA
jgi:hypothetical protein